MGIGVGIPAGKPDQANQNQAGCSSVDMGDLSECTSARAGTTNCKRDTRTEYTHTSTRLLLLLLRVHVLLTNRGCIEYLIVLFVEHRQGNTAQVPIYLMSAYSELLRLAKPGSSLQSPTVAGKYGVRSASK
ncbi:hypothetical protein X797_001608 [Metarhizium robertsii]|uniref:Uncharacterized protein n=1 Tax=Metarhizium robertsii TaxID=568076 RepID=A0A0A1V2Z0_9HYPO|nr:hypothetical protein X797_001608 [Metarhizium robertsii]